MCKNNAPKNYCTSQIMIEENPEYLSLPLKKKMIQKEIERRRQKKCQVHHENLKSKGKLWFLRA